MNVILGLLLMGAGGALMFRSYQIMEFFGRNDRAERNLGGTRNLIILIGFFLVITGGLVMFGIVQMGSV